MKGDLQAGLQSIIDAINNLIEPKLGSLKYDKTYRAKVTSFEGDNIYGVQINGKNYKAVYTGEKIPVGQIVKVKAPLNNFSDIYIETLPGSGTGEAGNYNDLLNKPILNTNNTVAQVPKATETIQGTISLHKISKTGNYDDLLNKPTLDFIPTSEKGAANGVARLDENGKVSKDDLPTDTVYDSNYVHTDNNFTTALKDKLDSVENGAQPNKIENIQKNGTTLTITNKTVNITVPTKTSELTNDSGYINSIPVASASKLGGIKVGNNLSITQDGTLNAEGGGVTAYEDLTGKPTLNTANTKGLAADSAEVINGIVSLHKISKTGSYNDLLDKPTIPTKTSQLTNDSGFIMNSVNNLTNYYLKTETYTQAEVKELIGQIKTISIVVVDSLPTTGESNKIYLVPKTGTTGDIYNEYIWVNNAWELIGSTQVDLTGYATQDWVNNQIKDFLNETQVTEIVNNSLKNYYTKTQVDTALNEKQNTITGAASSVVTENLAENVVVVSDSRGKINDSSVTATELSYISGARSNLQNQIDTITTSGGQPNVIEVVQENGVPLPVTNKTVNVTVPTKVSELDNDSNFISTIPVASSTTLGGIKVGNNLTIDSDGTLNAQEGGIKSYTDLTDKPTLNTNNSQSLVPQSAETIVAEISLHKVSKTGNYNDLNNKLNLENGSGTGAVQSLQATGASGDYSFAEGGNTTSSGTYSHAEGLGTIANGDNQHVQGKYNISDDTSLDIIGNGTGTNARSNAYTLDRNGNAWYSGDIYTGSTSGTNKDAGSKKVATEEYVDNKVVTDYDKLTNKPTLNTNVTTSQPVSESETITGEMVLHKISKTGSYNDLNNKLNIVNGSTTGSLRAVGSASESDRYKIGRYAFAEGGTAIGYQSHTEGAGMTGSFAFTITSGDSTAKTYTLSSVTGLTVGMLYSIQHGNTTARDAGTITAINSSTKTITVDTYKTLGTEDNYLFILKSPRLGDISYDEGEYAHAEGTGVAVGDYSHAEGHNTKALWASSHAEGESTIARGWRSHAEGYGTVANGMNQHVSGTYNIADNSYLVIVGNGSSDSSRSNAYTLDSRGDARFAGNVYSSTNSQLAKVSELNKYLPLTGGSLSGSLTVNGDIKTGNGVCYVRTYRGATTNFNQATTHGFYSFAGAATGITGCPVSSGNVYGTLEVTVQKSAKWVASDQSLYIWQKYMDTGGRLYTRYAVNSETFGAWRPIYLPESLYSNSSGTTGTVTLSSSAANFSYLEIYYENNIGDLNRCIKVSSPNGKSISIESIEPDQSSSSLVLYVRSAFYTISGTSITYKAAGYATMTNGATAYVNKNQYSKIVKVLGYR